MKIDLDLARAVYRDGLMQPDIGLTEMQAIDDVAKAIDGRRINGPDRARIIDAIIGEAIGELWGETAGDLAHPEPAAVDNAEGHRQLLEAQDREAVAQEMATPEWQAQHGAALAAVLDAPVNTDGTPRSSELDYRAPMYEEVLTETSSTVYVDLDDQAERDAATAGDGAIDGGV